jgi:hypothetical protein
MSEEFRKMMEANRKMWDRQGFVSDGYKKVGEMNTGVLTGKNSLVDLKEAQIDINYNADFSTNPNLKGAREIIGELRSTKRSADYSNDSDTSEACQKLIKKYMPEGIQELVAGE